MTKKQLINELITVKEQNRLLTVIQTKLTGLEDALRKSEKKYRELVNLLPQPVFEIDVEGNLTFSNIDGFKTFGYEYEDLYRGVNAFQMVVPEERSRMKCNMQKVLQGKALGGIEYSALKKDGTVFPIVVFSSPIMDHKKPTGIRGIIIELSKLKHAEEELRRSEHKYRLLVENANEIIVIIQDGQVKFANPKSTELTHYSEQELKSKPFIEFVHPDDREMVYSNYLKRTQGEPVPKDYCFRTVARGGTVKWLRINALTTTWENRPATLNFLIDITEQKKAEKELIEREKQLIQAQKMEAIGRLTGGIAHDFNNMLTVILGYSDHLLSQYRDDAKLTSYIQNLKHAGERAAALTQRLLAFSRRQILRPHVASLNSIIGHVAKMLTHLIGENIELVQDLDPRLGNARVDVNQIEQVIINLAINARDAMPGGGTIRIETANVRLDAEYAERHLSAVPGDYVMLAVSDNGTGIDEETLEHIFEPFYTTKQNGKGTGLGLATTYGIVKQSGGCIQVESEPGEGTTISIYFPRVTGESDTGDAGGEKTAALAGTESIVLVEDDDAVRNMIRSVLKKNGYDVTAVSSSDEAISFITGESSPHPKVDLLITDAIMPGMSGNDLFAKLKAEIPSLRILYISGYANEAVVQNGITDSGITFLQKPFLMDELCRKIRGILDG